LFFHFFFFIFILSHAAELTDWCPDHHVTDAGCLGPFSVNSDDPNWSNVNLYNHTCAEGSVILLLSAGVLRNFDPLYLGIFFMMMRL
jgi:hypothetical protein